MSAGPPLLKQVNNTMNMDYLNNPSPNNPKGYTTTSWYGTFNKIQKDKISISDFDCPIFWKKEYIKYFEEPIYVGSFNEDKIGFSRNWGGESKREGCWIHNRVFNSPVEAKKHLNLEDKWGNTAENQSLVRIKVGARYIRGRVKDGLGEQLYIHSKDVENGLVEFYENKSIGNQK